MIRIQLWCGDRLVLQKDVEGLKGAHWSIDQLIDDVQAGRYGEGSFSLNAYHVNPIGAFIGHYWRTDDLRYPVKLQEKAS